MQVSSAKTKKHVLIISADGFEDSELLQPYQQLSEEGVDADIASFSEGKISGKRGKSATANLSVDKVEPEKYDMLFLPGGKAPAELRKHEKILDIVRSFNDANKPIAAICHGPQILISAGVVQGKTATSYHSVADEMKEAGVNYVDQELVIDGNLITSRQPDDIPALVNEMLSRLK